MKKILKFSRKRRGLSPNSSDAGSVLSVGYEIKEKDLGKVHKAASVGDLAKVKQLAKKNDLNQLDKENRTPLHIACAYGHVEVVLFLVESKVKLNLCDNQNRSPLMKAVQCQQETCAQILLEHSADPNLVDINGNTALHQAALIPSVPLGTQLLEHGANIDARNKDGCTPLILAVTENHTEVVEFLLKEGADVNAKDQGKRTSLIIAACNGQISLIRLLLAYDADITIKDEKGWTSDDYAVINGHHACSHLIIEHGTRKKSQQSPSFMVQSKEKQVRGSQVEDAAAGFSLGRPATDREVDDSSQAESISRASKCGGDSWPSSDEDDGLELSPKKPRKLNLTKLINTSGKGRKNATADLENSWSEHESDPEHEDTAKSDPGLRETLPTSRTFLPSDSIHSAPPQKTSRGTAKAHAGDGDCSDVDHEEEEDEDSNEEEDGQNDEPAQKRDFLSELGLGGGADEDEGSWDSSVSDKPSKAHIDSVSGHPVTGKPEKTLLPEKAEEAGPGDNLQRKPAVLQSTPSPSPAAAAAMNSPNRKIDLMEELGLGDVDDIEDPSEWDSTTSSSKSHDVFKKESQLEPLASGMEPSLSSSLPIAPAGPSEEPAPSTIGGRTRTPQRVVCPSQQPGPCKPPVTTEHQKDTSLNKNMDRADPEEPEKVGSSQVLTWPSSVAEKDALDASGLGVNSLYHTNLGESEKQSAQQEGGTDEDSEASWERRYEKIWVETEKREVKSHYRSVTAELKEKFGELSWTEVKGASVLTPHSVEASEEEEGGRQAAIGTFLVPIAEQRESGLEDSLSEPRDTEPCGLQRRPHLILDATGSENKMDRYADKMEEQETQQEEEGRRVKDLDCEDIKPEGHSDNGSNLREDLGNLGSNRENEAGKADVKSVTFSDDPEIPGSPSWHVSCSDEELEKDVQRFKYEVGMLKVVFLHLEKEKAQLQNEVCKEKRMLSGTQNQCPLWDAERPTGRSVIPGDILEQEPGERSHKTSPETGKRGKEPDSLSQGGGLNDAKGTGMALEQEGAGSDKDTSPSKHQQATRGIGAVQSVFEDSSLSEVSEDEERCAVAGSVKNEVFGPLRVAEEMDIVDDLTQSSDTGTDEAEFPTSGFRNASLQIRQLDSACIDSVSMVKLQNIFHEYERTIQRERGRCARLSDKLSHLEEERADLKKVLEETRDAKSVLEHRQVELDTDLKNLMFTLKQEQEKHRNASMLYGKSCEQLRIKEEQYHAEVQERQKVELAKRNLELEMRALISSMKQLEDDHSETRRSLAHERNSRSIQEGILSTHLHKQKELEEENVRNFAKCNEAVSQLSEASEREKELVKQNQKVEEELSLLRLELDRVRSQGRQEEVCLTGENETLRERLEDARRDLKLSGEALAQTVYQFNSQISALKAECSMSAAKTEHERQAREKLEAEAESARVRLVAALQEVERSQAARADAERSLRREREDWQRALEKSSAELASQRESVLSLSQQLGTAEAKANSLENECHRATLSLTEKSLLVETLQRERDQAQARLGELEAALQAEREQASRAAARQEATRERLAQVQSEAMLLHQQVEESQNRGVTKERALLEAQERFGELLAQLRADSEERVRLVEERSKELVSKNAELREQLLGQELEKTEREAALRQLQQELADTLKKLSMCEASLEVNSRYRNDLEEEKMRIHKDMDRLRGRLQESEDQYVQAERRVRDLKSVLDDKQSEVITSSQRLQEALAAAVKTDKMVKQLEGAVQRLEIENARLEASAKQQGHKIEVLQKEAAENAETSDSSPGSAARSRLEDLVANLQGSKMTLEDKLIREVQKQSVLSHNAQDTHQLWENELKTRARLSLRLAELEREKGELSGQVEIEKKKVKKTTEAKKSTDIRLDQEMQRNGELQKEISRLKTLLKTAKRKLKEQQDVTAGSLLSKPEDRSSPVKSRVEEFTLHLEREKTKCSELEALNLELKEQLASLNALSRTNERLQRSKKQLEAEVASLRQQMETRMVEHSLVEQYRRKADERARQEVQQKLEEVNLFLQTQAASQEALEQLKAASEGSVRTQLEQRVRELEGELSQARGAQQDSLSQKESVLTELQRYRELYVEELELRKSLAAKLERSNERLAEVNAKLLDDRQRSRSLMASSISGPLLDVGLLSSVGPYGASLGGGNGPSTKVETFLAKMQNELEKNISRELEKASAELGSQSARMSPIGSVAASQRSLSVDQDPVARATQQYLDVLKKNYRI